MFPYEIVDVTAESVTYHLLVSISLRNVTAVGIFIFVVIGAFALWRIRKSSGAVVVVYDEIPKHKDIDVVVPEEEQHQQKMVVVVQENKDLVVHVADAEIQENIVVVSAARKNRTITTTKRRTEVDKLRDSGDWVYLCPGGRRTYESATPGYLHTHKNKNV